MSHSKAAAIFVIPPSKDLDEMIKRFQSELKKEGLVEFSEQAIKWAAVSPCEYKRYIFDLFADADPTNYRLANEPAFKNFGTIKRTNRLKEQYYFKYVDANTIKVVSEENATKGETLKLVAKTTASQIFIFEGNLPECKQKYTQTILLTGGNNDSYSDNQEILEAKQELLKKYGAYKFVCSMAHYNDVSKDFSSDIQHAAFSILFDPKMNRVPSKPLKKHELATTYRKLVMGMKLLNSKSNYSSCQKTLAGIYQNMDSTDAIEASESYIDSLKSYYKKAGGTVMLKADVATNMWRNGYSNDYNSIFEVAEAIDDPNNTELLSEATKVDFTDDDKQFITSKLCSIIHSNLCSFPFIGLNARNYYPNVTFTGGFDGAELEDEFTHEIIQMKAGSKKKKKGMRGGDDDEDISNQDYDDNNEDEDDDMTNEFYQDKSGKKKKKVVKKKVSPKKKKGMRGGDDEEEEGEFDDVGEEDEVEKEVEEDSDNVEEYAYEYEFYQDKSGKKKKKVVKKKVSPKKKKKVMRGGDDDFEQQLTEYDNQQAVLSESNYSAYI
jgi:hypothetical protein